MKKLKRIVSLLMVIAMLSTTSFGATFTKVSGGHSISINVDSGKAVKIRALDIFGKIFNGWTITGATVDDQSQKEIEITMGENDVTATANYLTPYTIAVNQTANGVISPSTVTVGEGTNQVFTITPNTSHKIVDVLLDGTSVLSSLVAGTGNEKTYTLSNIQGNHVLTASFKSDGSSNSSTTSMGTPNAPVLASGLIPVNWDGSSWVNTTEDNWDYNYNSVATTTHETVAGNGNGKWDTGDFDANLQPEEVRYYPKALKVRKGWDMEEDWNVNATSLETQRLPEIKGVNANKKSKNK